ncbi:cation transporter [Babesia caballi]|uniref:Cation transporter n=1 Tax=Babesia caballi TaxID=5871 RepID=A0AAV4M3E6_BABCB|nr:cation transporter [Babesia caballi]GIX66390.1 cation transporter [Babesia caballi]
MSGARKETAQASVPSDPDDMAVRMEQVKGASDTAGTYFWRDPSNRELLRKHRSDVARKDVPVDGGEGERVDAGDSNIYDLRLAKHRTIPYEVYIRQKAASRR